MNNKLNNCTEQGTMPATVPFASILHTVKNLLAGLNPLNLEILKAQKRTRRLSRDQRAHSYNLIHMKINDDTRARSMLILQSGSLIPKVLVSPCRRQSMCREKHCPFLGGRACSGSRPRARRLGRRCAQA